MTPLPLNQQYLPLYPGPVERLIRRQYLLRDSEEKNPVAVNTGTQTAGVVNDHGLIDLKAEDRVEEYSCPVVEQVSREPTCQEPGLDTLLHYMGEFSIPF